MRISARFWLVLVFALAGHSAGPVADTPPMGWNSWDCYGTTVTEAEVMANANFMAKHLKRYGWQYVVVDIQWSDPQAKAHGYRPNAVLAMDANGRLIPAPNRFPSSAGGLGFKPLADRIHALGLRFGIHIMRGIPRRAVDANLPIEDSDATAEEIADRHSVCPWNSDMYGVDTERPGAQDYYDSLLRLYAAWGVDFIKADDMAHPMHRDEIAALSAAIRKSGRPIVLSLSPGPASLKDSAFLHEHANMWRIADDFWDDFGSLRHMFGLLSEWGGTGYPGAWPDADMLPLGHIGIRAERGNDRTSRFTRDEARTVITLWSIVQSPLIFGGDLPTTDPYTISLLTNPEILEANQHASFAREFFESADQIVWSSRASDGRSRYLAVFNLGATPAGIHVDLENLWFYKACALRDLWSRSGRGNVQGGLDVRLPAHGAGMYKLTPR